MINDNNNNRVIPVVINILSHILNVTCIEKKCEICILINLKQGQIAVLRSEKLSSNHNFHDFKISYNVRYKTRFYLHQ